MCDEGICPNLSYICIWQCYNQNQEPKVASVEKEQKRMLKSDVAIVPLTCDWGSPLTSLENENFVNPSTKEMWPLRAGLEVLMNGPE